MLRGLFSCAESSHVECVTTPELTIPAIDRAALAKLGAKVRERLAGDPSVYRVPAEQAEIYAIGDFLSADECARFIAFVDQVAKPSGVLGEDAPEGHRTSYSGDVDQNDPFVKMVERRISDLLGIDPAWGEAVQGQRYHPGQEFRDHVDWFDTRADYWTTEIARGGQRSWTAMAFLNDVEAGGATEFSRLGISITPQRGSLLVWNNADKDGFVNLETMHAGRPVERGVKYVITKWFRTRKWQ